MGNFLTTSETTNFSKVTQPHGMNHLIYCHTVFLDQITVYGVESSWSVMVHSDAGEGKWRRNWWMKWVASTLHTTSEHGVYSINTADAHTSAASSRLNCHPCWFKLTHPFCWKTKSGFCAYAITFQMQSNMYSVHSSRALHRLHDCYSILYCTCTRFRGI